MSHGLQLTGLSLRVRDLTAQLGFYHQLLGLPILLQNPQKTVLGFAGGPFTLSLYPDMRAELRPQPSLGLYHFALLLPDRPSLAAVVHQLAQARYPAFQGASDHGVSEALYLADPEGNGLELYVDRPLAQWPRQGDQLAMASDPLDLPGLLAQAEQAAVLPPTTRLGHLHLHVANLDTTQTFFAQLGLEVTQGDYPGARFMATDGYHHHLGFNLWARGRQAPAGSTGLMAYSLASPQYTPGERADPNGTRVILQTR
jgi:catechol 2,3-dioxygenase